MDKKPFVIAWSSSLDKFEDLVCDFLKDGYELRGDVFQHTDGDGDMLSAQALVLKRKHRKKEVS